MKHHGLLKTLDAMEALIDTPSEHLGRTLLSRLAAGDLSDSEQADATVHLQDCARCQSLLREAQAADAAFRVRYPTARFLNEIEQRITPQRATVWARIFSLPSLLAVGLVGAAAAAAFLFTPPPQPVTPPAVVSGNRLKAAVDLTFHVRSGDTIELGEPGGRYHPGDQIQMRYSTPKHRYLVVVSMDSAGAVTPFYANGPAALDIEPGVAQLLEGAIELDDTLGPERIMGCFSDTPVESAEVVNAARAALKAAGGDPKRVKALPLDCAQSTFVIQKAARP